MLWGSAASRVAGQQGSLHLGLAPGGPRRRAAFRCWASSVRKPKDPSSYNSMDELREEIEREQSGFVTGLINWLSAAATSTASGFDLRAAYRRLLALRPGLGRSMDDEHDSDILARLEAQVGAEQVAALQTLLLGTRMSTLRIIRKYPDILSMPRRDLMQRLVWLKGLFPENDVSRMVELAPASFLAGDWVAVQEQVGTAAELLRGGLAGANFALMFTEDPMILFEEPDSLRQGLRRLHELWAVDETALGNSDPLHLTLALRALGTNGPPKGF